MGKPMTEEHRQKISMALLGKPQPKLRGNKNACRTMPTEERKKRSEVAKERGLGKWMLGRTAWNKGKPAFWVENEKSPNWKGDAVGKTALHDWVKKRRGFPNKCEACGYESDSHHKIHWANKSGEYKRDLTDWVRLCVRCHKRYDNEKRKIRIWRNQFSSGTY